MIKNTEMPQFNEVDVSIKDLADKLLSSTEKSMISAKTKEALNQMKGALSLEKSTSFADKSTTPTKKSTTLALTVVEKMPMSVRTKALISKRPKGFSFRLKLPSMGTPDLENSMILALNAPSGQSKNLATSPLR